MLQMDLLKGERKMCWYLTVKAICLLSFIDIDRIISVRALPGSHQNVFHVVTQGRTYELLAHDEVSMNKYVNYIHITIAV